jgi:hypothetical protein
MLSRHVDWTLLEGYRHEGLVLKAQPWTPELLKIKVSPSSQCRLHLCIEPHHRAAPSLGSTEWEQPKCESALPGLRDYLCLEPHLAGLENCRSCPHRVTTRTMEAAELNPRAPIGGVTHSTTDRGFFVLCTTPLPLDAARRPSHALKQWGSSAGDRREYSGTQVDGRNVQLGDDQHVTRCRIPPRASRVAR